MRRLPLRNLLVLSAAISFALVPALADAAKPAKETGGLGQLKTASAITTIVGAAGTLGSATARCPKGTKAISGGFTSNPVLPNSSITTYESVRVGSRAWRVSAVAVGAAVQHVQNLTVFVYCGEGDTPKKRQATGTVPAAPNSTLDAGSVDAACPKGTKAISGGYSFPSPTQTTAAFVHRSSAKGSRSWRTTVTSSTAGATATTIPVTTSVHCIEGPALKKTKATVPATPSTPVTAFAPSCPKQVVSGGFIAPSVIPTGMIPVITESRRLSRRQWQTSVFPSGTQATTLTAVGYCG